MKKSLNSSQKSKVNEFKGIVSVNESVATQFLERHKWNLEQALDTFFNEGNMGEFPELQPQVSIKDVEAVFAKYKDPKNDQITQNGIIQFCQDLEIELTDPVILVISFYFKAEVMGVYKKSEFMQGMQALGCESVGQLKSQLTDLKSQLHDKRKFKEIYQFVFLFSRDPGVKNIPQDQAIQLWQLIFEAHFKYLPQWIQFLESRNKKFDISKDTWNMLLEFADDIGFKDVKDYEDDGTWPVLIDEFLQFLRGQ